MRWHLALAAALLSVSLQAEAEKRYGPGVTDSQIKIGNTMPYSGPASAYATQGKASAAYFAKINQEGGVNGRRIEFITLDDAYSPPKTVEQVRKLVEQEQVLAIFSSLGTPTNTAVHKYLNAARVPQLFVATGASKWGDPKNFPWTMGFNPNYRSEGSIYGKYIVKTHPEARIAVLYQNDDYGKDYLRGLKDGLGDRAGSMIVAEATYETSDPGIDSQIITLKTSGADTFVDITTPKFAAMAIRKVYDVGWKPHHFLNNVSASVATVLVPAGLEKSAGVISASFAKDPNDPQWSSDAGVREFLVWMKQYYPDGNPSDLSNVYGYTWSQALVHVLKQCGDDLTRENLMRQAANIKDLELPMLLPGIRINTSPTDFYPIEQMQLQRFDGTRWVRFGEIMGQ
jgi:branched-chain amino acid transport system substrate-binding protein